MRWWSSSTAGSSEVSARSSWASCRAPIARSPAENADLVAVSIDTREDALLMLELAGAEFPILADPYREATLSYGVFDLLGDGVATPSTS